MKRLLALFAVLWVGIAVGQTSWYNASWGYRVKITVDADYVTSDVTDMPVYVDLNDLPAGFHAHVNQTDARDIRVTEADGETELPREVVFYTAGSDTGELHFLAAGTLSSTVDTDFWVYYGNPSASEPASDATYGSEAVWAGYEAIYHLHGSDSGRLADSTANDNTLTENGSPTANASGLMGTGITVARNSTWLITPWGNAVNIGSVDLTMCVWFNSSAFTGAGDDHVFAYGNSGTNNRFYWRVRSAASFQARLMAANPTNHSISPSTSTWYRGCITADAGTDTYDTYYNGTIMNNHTDVGYTPAAFAGNFFIGTAANANAEGINATIDEVWISEADYSAGRIATEYNNQSAPGTFWVIGDEEEGTVGTSRRIVISN